MRCFINAFHQTFECSRESIHFIFENGRSSDTVVLNELMVLNELIDSDDEKPQRGKTRNWIKRRHDRGYFNNIIQELRVEDRFGFREMFRMNVTDFENILAKISDIILPKERLG